MVLLNNLLSENCNDTFKSDVCDDPITTGWTIFTVIQVIVTIFGLFFNLITVITLGLKQIPCLSFDRVDKLRIRITDPNTFHGTFIKAWNTHLPRELRKSLILAYKIKNHSKIKNILKSHFRLDKTSYETRTENAWTEQ